VARSCIYAFHMQSHGSFATVHLSVIFSVTVKKENTL